MITDMRLPNSDITIEFHQQTSPDIVRDVNELLLSRWWKRNWSEDRANDIFKWRYGESSGSETVLAYDGDRLVAMIGSYLRPYFVHRQLTFVREPADWFCRPEYRHLHLGVRLMCLLMDREEPLLSIGGNDDANAILALLGWRRLAPTAIYTLPLTRKFLVSTLGCMLCLPITRFAGRKFGDKSWPALPRCSQEGHETQPCGRLMSSHRSIEITSAASAYDVVPLMRERELEWLYAAPADMGTFFCLDFTENREEIGFALGRLYCADGLKYGKVIHLQSSSQSVEGFRRMLAETVSYMRNYKADVVQCRASAPLLRRALKRMGFIWSGSNLVHCWAKHGIRLEGTHHLTFLRGDDPTLPPPQ